MELTAYWDSDRFHKRCQRQKEHNSLYIAAAECCTELKYLQTLNSELSGKPRNATINVDNQSAIATFVWELI